MSELFSIWSKQIKIDRVRFQKKIEENVKMFSFKLPNEFRKTFETIWFSQMSNLNRRDDFKTLSNHKQPEKKVNSSKKW